MLKKYPLFTVLGVLAILTLSAFAPPIPVTGFQTPPMSDFVPSIPVTGSLDARLARLDALELQKDMLPVSLLDARLARLDALELQKDVSPVSPLDARLARIDALELQKDVIP